MSGWSSLRSVQLRGRGAGRAAAAACALNALPCSRSVARRGNSAGQVAGSWPAQARVQRARREKERQVLRACIDCTAVLCYPIPQQQAPARTSRSPHPSNPPTFLCPASAKHSPRSPFCERSRCSSRANAPAAPGAHHPPPSAASPSGHQSACSASRPASPSSPYPSLFSPRSRRRRSANTLAPPAQPAGSPPVGGRSARREATGGRALCWAARTGCTQSRQLGRRIKNCSAPPGAPLARAQRAP